MPLLINLNLVIPVNLHNVCLSLLILRQLLAKGCELLGRLDATPLLQKVIYKEGNVS